MTAQFDEGITYLNNTYSIIAVQNKLNFDPSQYGIELDTNCCTACRKGFVCHYKIINEKLVLANLALFTNQKCTIQINSIEPIPDRFFTLAYKNISVPMNYNGGIIIGKDFLKEYYVHMGFQQAYSYKTVLELKFDDGVLKDVIDHSNFIDTIRTKLQNKEITFERGLSEFIANAFSMSYDEKWFFSGLKNRSRDHCLK